MKGLLRKIIPNGNERQLTRLQKIADQVEAFSDQMKQLSDDQLRNKTEEYKERIEKGEKLDKMLPEVYATVREASDRVLGMRPFPVQIMGAAALHEGNIAEMKTGEGKTLTCNNACLS